MSELGTYHGESTIMRKTLDWSLDILNSGRWTKFRNPVILSVLAHLVCCQNDGLSLCSSATGRQCVVFEIGI
jgi:hypothetical protein